mgnify:FL=1
MVRNILYLFFVLVLLNACQTIKSSMSSSKDNDAEFLVEKKNPLVQPPEFDKLPKPKSINEKNESANNLEIKTNTSTNSTYNDSLEDSILKKIKTN